MRQTFTASEFPDTPAGTVRDLTWTFAIPCPAAPCRGTITSASGAVYQVTFDGTRLTGASNRQETVGCFDDAGRQTAGSSTSDFVNQLDAVLVVGGPGAAQLTGTVVQTGTVVSVEPPCEGGPGTVRTSTADLAGERTS